MNRQQRSMHRRLWRRSMGPLVAVAALATAPRPAAAADLARGKEIFRLCSQCHGPDGEGNAAALAPTIANLPDWYVRAQLENFKTGVRGKHPDDAAGLRMYPMSQTLKTQADLDDVAAYVASLPKVKPKDVLTGGDAARGAPLYQPCIACHGPAGLGNQAVNAPPISTQSDWYLLSSLEKFKTGVRAGYPTALIMRGMANTLPNEQAMKDVIAYVTSLSQQTADNAPH